MIILKPPRFRSQEELLKVKKLCDYYHKDPPINLTEIRNARLHEILIINVDQATAYEVDPELYIEMCNNYRSTLMKHRNSIVRI
ncbi:MAG: hypothetical protein NDF55_09040 [archaeon GB-1867-005]|nr:hypothetical protein [Candidatus Culexmicrobium cathedralense]